MKIPPFHWVADLIADLIGFNDFTQGFQYGVQHECDKCSGIRLLIRCSQDLIIGFLPILEYNYPKPLKKTIAFVQTAPDQFY